MCGLVSEMGGTWKSFLATKVFGEWFCAGILFELLKEISHKLKFEFSGKLLRS